MYLKSKIYPETHNNKISFNSKSKKLYKKLIKKKYKMIQNLNQIINYYQELINLQSLLISLTQFMMIIKILLHSNLKYLKHMNLTYKKLKCINLLNYKFDQLLCLIKNVLRNKLGLELNI